MSLMRQHLTAIREQAKAIMASAEALIHALEIPPPEPGDCMHPPERRLAAPTMGRPEGWVCACGVEGGE